jgi:hypothetical protein
VNPTPEARESASLILCDFPVSAATPSPTPQRAQPADSWLPDGVYIPCILQGGLDSSHMDTPVEAVVTENVYQRDYGKSQLIIPAGSRLFAFATPGYIQDRVQVKGEWRLIFVNDATEVSFQGIACNMEFNAATNRYGLGDKTAGIQGIIQTSDHWIVVKSLLGLILTTGANAAQGIASSALQGSSNGNSLNVQVPSVSPIIDQYVKQIINPTGKNLEDVFFVRIPAGKPFWVVTTSIIEPQLRSKGARLQESMTPKTPLNDSAAAMLDPKKALEQIEQLQQKDPNAPDNAQNSAAHFNR